MKREELTRYLDELLEAGRFRDYCPNGLQVEGKAEIGRLVAGVTASQALLDAAVAQGADAVLVHHGWFWKNEDGRLTGFRKRRMATLMQHDLNLIAYHLPLDAHPELGNNAQLARLCGWQPEGRFGERGATDVAEADEQDGGLLRLRRHGMAFDAVRRCHYAAPLARRKLRSPVVSSCAAPPRGARSGSVHP